MQDMHDLWCARKTMDLEGVERLRFAEPNSEMQPTHWSARLIAVFGRLGSVMKPELNDFERTIHDAIHHAMLIRDSSRPEAR